MCIGEVMLRTPSEVAGRTDVVVHFRPDDVVSEVTLTTLSDGLMDRRLAIGARVVVTVETE